MDNDLVSEPALPEIPEKAVARWIRRPPGWLKWTLRLLGAAIAYGLCWIGAYAVVNGDLDGELMVRYFALAWTGGGFVRPTFAWLISLVAFSFVLVGWTLLRRSMRRRGR